MKYVVLIHSAPQPWGHPTQQLTSEGRALSEEEHAEMDRAFDTVWASIEERGELVSAAALGDPATARLFGWRPEGHVASDGPFAETKEQLAGFFLFDVSSAERAEEIAAAFAQPGGTVELRPCWEG